jgi:3-hydroxyacyl-CoA dehydrogenase/enoyl-CoA hydratase/3-hydroxybutyryl-CoA epimerase
MATNKAFQLMTKTTSKGDVAVLEFDLPGEKVNKFSTPVMIEFKETLEAINQSKALALIIISKKSKIFIAGADIDEIKVMTTKDQFEKAVAGGQNVFNILEDLRIPTIAAINGACMGGGTEMILACDYRIATDDPSTKIGLPETQLGIIPGFGGCVRLPRLIGIPNSLDIILAGKAVNSKKASKIGLVNDVVHQNILLDYALQIAEKMIPGGKPVKKSYEPQGVMDKFIHSFLGKGIAFGKARDGVLKATSGHYPAPLMALEVVKKTYGWSDRETALRIEREGFCEMGITDISKNLIHVFHLTEMVKKQNGVPGVDIKGKEVKGLGILGAGTMGGGIAYVAADKGISVRMKDLNLDALGKGMKHASDLWMKLMKRKSIDEYQYKQKISLVSTTTDYSGFGQLDVIVEAIVEDMGIKQKVIGETATYCKADAIIATNTSSLSVNEMSKGHPRPELFAGMHFFNPVNKMPLVEVIRGEKTSDQTIATIYELSKKMGKMPVVVKDGPGFLVNRLLLPYMAEAAFLMQEGMSIETVDKMFKKEFGMPMGPFRLMDEVGLDVCIKVLKIFKKAFGDRVELAPCMEQLEKTKLLGRKGDKGFYVFTTEGKNVKEEVNPEIYTLLGLPTPTNPLSNKECLERGVFAMINECSRALFDDHIVQTPHEVDLAMIMGTGFPPFRGGLTKYADSLGAKYIVGQLKTYAGKQGAKRLTPAPALVTLSEGSNKFYE